VPRRARNGSTGHAKTAERESLLIGDASVQNSPMPFRFIQLLQPAIGERPDSIDQLATGVGSGASQVAAVLAPPPAFKRVSAALFTWEVLDQEEALR
jgi:hypothetical protein